MLQVLRTSILINLLCIFSLFTNGQACNGSLGAPVINETFGRGAAQGVGPPLSVGITDLSYINDPCGGDDGTYTLLTSMGSSCKGGTWQAIDHDHTNDGNGYMMIINASIIPNTFFTYRIDGSKLCPNTTYQFAAWIMNILVNLPQTQGFSQPNITFNIETLDGKLLQTYNTGTIPSTEQPIWSQYGTFFTSPADGSDLIVKMVNNGPGGDGNDLALDDITVSACGPLIKSGFATVNDNAPKSNCVGNDLFYPLVANQTAYSNPSYQWQINKNDGNGWINITGATSASYNVTIKDAQAGKYEFRIGVLSSNNAGSENCRIFSDPLIINVYSLPTFSLPQFTSACMGQVLQLYADGGDSYFWTGPNGFTSADENPLISNNVSLTMGGRYTVKITKNNCPFFTTTYVNVYQLPAINSISKVSICAGTSTQLTANTTNTTHYKWMPATGLNNDSIANPIAAPLLTTTYKVMVSNEGCPDSVASASVTVTVNQLPVANAGNEIRLFQGQSASLNGSTTGDKVIYYWTPADYLDDPESLTPVTTSPANITYTLHVQSTVGCGESSSSVFVRVYKKLTLVNTFTPNGDGINDYWNIKNIDDYPKAIVSIFNRYGQSVFESKGYPKPWDGTYNGGNLPAGTYYYLINLNEDSLPEQSGWIFIKR